MGADLFVIVLGVLAGGIAGMFGVGGGVVFVPTLALVLGMSELHAQATSLLAIIPVAALGTWRERRSGAVSRRDVAVIGAASIATAIMGALTANIAPEHALRIGFAAILVVTAAQMVRGVLRQRARRLAAETAGETP